MSSAFERAMKGGPPVPPTPFTPLDPHFCACARPFEVRRSRDTLQTILVDVFKHDAEALAKIREQNRVVLVTMICEEDLAQQLYEVARSFWPATQLRQSLPKDDAARDAWRMMTKAQRERLLRFTTDCPKWGEKLGRLTKRFDELGLTVKGANPWQRRPSHFAQAVAIAGRAELHCKKEKKACPPSRSRISGTSRRPTATSVSSRSTSATPRSSTSSSATPKRRR